MRPKGGVEDAVLGIVRKRKTYRYPGKGSSQKQKWCGFFLTKILVYFFSPFFWKKTGNLFGCGQAQLRFTIKRSADQGITIYLSVEHIYRSDGAVRQRAVALGRDVKYDSDKAWECLAPGSSDRENVF